LRDDPIFEVTQPSKIWEYMLNARPVVYGGAGEAAAAVAASGGGIVVPPDDPQAMANAIRGLLDNPEQAADMGQQGRAYVLANKRREATLVEFDTFLRALPPRK
jgi:glycosyltransferase involved in cell wall biosynthesis